MRVGTVIFDVEDAAEAICLAVFKMSDLFAGAFDAQIPDVLQHCSCYLDLSGHVLGAKEGFIGADEQVGRRLGLYKKVNQVFNLGIGLQVLFWRQC